MGTFVHSPKLNFSFQNAVVLDLYAWLQDEVLLEVELSCYILLNPIWNSYWMPCSKYDTSYMSGGWY